MSRPRRSEHNRQALIDEGIRQLSENGYHGTGIKQILDVVAVPKGSFYNYFESKEAFVAEIIDEYTRCNTALFDQFVSQSHLSALEKIEAVQTYLFNQYDADQCQRGCLVGSVAAEIGAASSLFQVAFNRSRQQWHARFTSLLRDAQAHAEIRSDVGAEALAECYWAAWEGALIRMRMDGNTIAARATMSVLLRQLFTPPTAAGN